MEKPKAIQTLNLIQVCQESLVVRKMLISTEAAGSQGTSGTEKVRAEGSWGCLWMTTRQRNILTRIMMMTMLCDLLEAVETSTDKGMQRRVKRMMTPPMNLDKETHRKLN